MKRVLSWVVCVALVGLAAGCGNKTHPVKVIVDPSFHKETIERIAVFPIASALSPTADPDGLARTTFDQLLRGELDKRQDYHWLGPTSVEYALDTEGLKNDAKKFVDGWRNNHRADTDFLAKMGKVLQVDGVLLGVVELWQQEAGAAYVAATITIFDAGDGHVLFEAADEDMAKGAKSEARNVEIIGRGSTTADRRATETVVRSHTGWTPLPDEVAIKVAQALVASIPSR
jgi:hypothetical protein